MTRLIVKLGGSSAGRAQMQQWIDILANAVLPLVIVPGGGPFADQVRIAQRKLAISDDAAHQMAILAMDQFGIAIAERHSRFQLARSLGEINSAIAAGRVPVWLPSAMTLGAPDIPCSWDVTSDSLSAWLAKTIGAPSLLLVKQTDDYRQYSNVSELAEAGIVDAMLPEMLAPDTLLHIVGPQTLATLDLPLATIPGRPIMRRRIVEAMDAG